jgi:hypothetical protein
VIPRGVRFIADSAFQYARLASISIESGNERFVVRDDFLIDIVDHKLIRNVSSSSSVIIPCDIEILGASCFACCTFLESVSFEFNSRLSRSESEAFTDFSGRITLPSAVLFVAHDAIPDPSQLSLCDEDSCPEFGRWRRVRQSGTAVDFRRIVRGDACARLPLDLTGFQEGSVIGKARRLYRRAKDGMEIVVEAFGVSEFDSGEVDREIENLSNLRHPLISKTIGFAVAEAELKIGRLHAAGGSLAEVVSSKPAWWTPTAKAEAVVGIAVALRFAHGLGLLHGDLNSGNILFDGGGRIQIADFRPMHRGAGGGGFSGEREGEGEDWSPEADVSAFAMVLFEIVAGRPWLSPPPPASAARANGDVNVILPPGVPPFVSEMIEGGLRPMAGEELSFIEIFETLKDHGFGIVAGVDSEEVSAFVRRVESAADSGDLE